MEKGIDPKALFKISYGIYVVTSCHQGKANGLIANTVCQVSSDPPRLSVCIHKKSLTHEYVSQSGLFAVSALDESTPLKFIGIFGFNTGRKIDKLSMVCHHNGVSGCAVLTENAIAAFECKVVNAVDAGTHTIFIGDLLSAELLNPGLPLTYSYYREHLRGMTPKNAPTYVPKTELKEEKTTGGKAVMKKYICEVCGYVYDPAEGDPDNGVSKGTPFEQIPDAWVCPVCGAGKDQFSPQE